MPRRIYFDIDKYTPLTKVYPNNGTTEIRVLCSDRIGEYPVVGLQTESNGYQTIVEIAKKSVRFEMEIPDTYIITPNPDGNFVVRNVISRIPVAIVYSREDAELICNYFNSIR